MARRAKTTTEWATVPSRSLAEVARSGFSIAQRPLARVAYEVHHVRDQPGYLRDVLLEREERDQFIETLTTAAYGSGLVIAASTVPYDNDGQSILGAPYPVRVADTARARQFSGRAIPNVSFVYDRTRVFEGLIAIGDVDTCFDAHHGPAILETLELVGTIAAEIADQPVISLQSPVQLPASMYSSTERAEQDEEMKRISASKLLPRSSAVAVRFAIALRSPSAKLRLALADAATDFCTKRGFGFWIADARTGFRAGNWFEVCPLCDSGLNHESHRQGLWAIPLTFVGPARIGAVKSIANYLQSYGSLGVAACSMSIVDDVDFFHIQLMSTSVDASLAGVERAQNRLIESGNQFGSVRLTDPPTVLPAIAGELVGNLNDPPRDQIADDLKQKIGDFHLLCGPSQELDLVSGTSRIALWISWEVEGHSSELREPLMALYAVLERLGGSMAEAPRDQEGPNLEYLICRRVRHAMLRGKGKMSFPQRLLDSVAGANVHLALSGLCERIEEAWRAQIGESRRVRELTVAWRENWLGQWSGILD